MGTQYVDDHRFLLCKGSTVTDITRAVSQPEARDELDALSVELTFTAVRNNNRDKYMHWYGIEPGDKLRVVNHGREVFSGVILTVGLDGAGRGAADVRQGGDRRRNHRPAAHPDLPGVGRVHPGADPGGHPGHLLCGDGTHLPPASPGRRSAGGAAADRPHHCLPQAGGKSGGL